MFQSPLLHQLFLALAVLSWAVVIGGFWYARFFVSDVVAPMAIKSPEGFTQVFGFTVGWLVSALAFVGSGLTLLLSSQQSSALTAATVVSGLYFLPVVAFLVGAAVIK